MANPDLCAALGMSDTELSKLLMDARTLTPLDRLSYSEAEAVFAKLAELGYVIKAPAAMPFSRIDPTGAFGSSGIGRG